MKAVKSTDPRKTNFKAMLLKAGNGTKVTNMKEDDTHVQGDVLYRGEDPELKKMGRSVYCWIKRGTFKVAK